MQEIYEKYYWQNDMVRLRAFRPEDKSYENDLDSEMWSMASEETVLPIAKKEEKTAEQNEKTPSFVIENLNGDYIGSIRFNEINERHGTFSAGFMLL
ncbi:hypothetical protein FACS1894105_10590 [Clostridia bacterium]|nr:hypothetical protein FACS1894105_10590 [Clostridia bacterium]